MESSGAKTPWHLWVVGLSVLVLYGWGAGWGLWYLLTGAVDHVVDPIWLLGLWAATLGAVALLLKRKEARLLFAAVLVAAAASIAAVNLGAADQIWPPVILLNCVLLLLGGGLPLLYARAMARRGVLR